MINQSTNGNYWSSSPNAAGSAYGANLNFNSTGVNPSNNGNRANGLTVRCVASENLSSRLYSLFPYRSMDRQLLEDLFRAYYDARRNKRNTHNQLHFELRLEDYLLRLYHELLDRTYTPGRSVAFIINRPVKREVFAAGFADRVIHHLYFNYVNEIFERTFIDDCYSCRKNKGTSYGIERLDHHIRSCSHNYTRDCYVLKLDLSGYFMSIDRGLLYEKVIRTLLRFSGRRNTRGERWADALDYDLIFFLSRQIIFNDPTLHCIVRGERADWEGLPADKSLFTAAPGCGLPIGNLTSQLFSNVYLTDFDHFVKRELGFRHYGRYVDDFYLIHPSRRVLVEAIDTIRDYLATHLRIRLHPNKIYLQHYCRGVEFLGAVIKPYRIYAGGRVVSNFRRALDDMERGGVCKQQLVPVINSYLGLMHHYRNFDLRKRIVDAHRWVFDYGWVDVNYRRFRWEESEQLQKLPPDEREL